MKISINEIIDYQKCPMLFRLRYVDKIDGWDIVEDVIKKPNKFHIREMYDKAIHVGLFNIFHEIQNGTYPSEYLLKQRWGNIWANGKRMNEIFFESRKHIDEHRKKMIEGLDVLLDARKYFKENPGIPIIIGKEYNVKIGDNELIGRIDLVREIKDKKKKIQIVEFKTHSKNSKTIIKNDIETTAASYAFRELFKFKEDNILIYNVITNRVEITFRNNKDYDILKYIVDNIVTGIKNNIFYPVLNEQCYECPFYKECEKGRWK